MTLTERRQLLSSLKEIVATRNNPALAEAIVNALGAVGIDVALDYLRTQKIASALRDANAIEELRNLIDARVRALPGSDRVRLQHHFNVCVRIQEIFSEIDKQSLAVPGLAAERCPVFTIC